MLLRCRRAFHKPVELRPKHCLSLRHTHAWLKPSHDFNPIVVLLEIVVAWLESRQKNHVGVHRQIQVRHIAWFSTEETRRHNTHDHKRLVIEANRLPDGCGDVREMPLCEAMAD